MSDVVGSASVTVTPDMSNFASDLTAALGPAMSQAQSEFASLGVSATAAGDDIKSGIGGGVTSVADIITGVALGNLIADGVKAGVAMAIDAVESLASFFPKLGAEIQGAFNTVNASTTATGPLLDGLKANVENIARTSPAAFGDIANGVATVNRQLGLTGPELELTTRRIIQLSRITGTDLAANLKGATTAFNQFNIGAADQEHALDELLRVYQNTGISVTDLEQGLAKVGATAQLQGLSFEQTASFLGLLYKQTGDTGSATQAFNKILADSVKSGKDVKTQFRATFDGIRNGTIDLAEGFKIFGPRAASVFAQIRSGKLDFDSLSASIDEGGKTIAGVASDVSTWQGQLKILTNNLKVDLGPVAVQVFQHITDVVKLLVPIVKELSPVFTAVAAALKPVFEALSPILAELAKTIGAGLVSLIQQLAPAFVDVAIAIAPLIKPLGDVVAQLVTGLAPILADLIKNGFVPLVQELLPQLVKLFTDPAFVEAVKQLALAFSDIVKALIDTGLLQAITDLMVQLALPAIGLFRDAIVAIRDVMKSEDFKNGIAIIRGSIQGFTGDVNSNTGALTINKQAVKDWQDSFDYGATSVGEAVQAIQSGFGKMGSFIVDEVFDPIIGSLQQLFEWLGNLGEPFGHVADTMEHLGQVGWDLLQNVLDPIVGVLQTMFGWLGDIIEKMEEFAGKIPDWLKGSGQGPGGFLPGFAAGGVVPGAIGEPMLAMVHGGELIIPPEVMSGLSGGSAVPFMGAAPVAASGGDSPINIYVTVPEGTTNPEAVGAAFGDAAGEAFVRRTNIKTAVRTSPSSAR